MSADFNRILSDLKNRIYHPIYLLSGEEPYFIDLLCDAIENGVLTEDEKGFNQTILYGREVDSRTIVEHAKRYPMMASHQVVIVKEAQDIKTIDELSVYAEKPLVSTILVICYKYKKYDKRKSLSKVVEKKGVFFESTKVREDKLPAWITAQAESQGYTLTPKAVAMISDYLGNDLSKVENELKKLYISLPRGSQITEKIVEANIGISKDYNIFELQNALGARNIVKANRIITYFASNPKDNPLVKNIILLYGYFSKLLIYHSLPDKSNKEVASALSISPFFVNDYHSAARNYTFEQLTGIISLLREYDLKSKGVDSGSATEEDLTKELIYKILH
ncbi:MAG: DNA polymerase III subunit delta [Bacteroidetes bacterium]|nr:MAG: DNA polymerase III subunit delta [Bacteroidota bacterium]